MNKATKFRKIRDGEKLKKGTIVTHSGTTTDRLVIAKNSEGDGYISVSYILRSGEKNDKNGRPRGYVYDACPACYFLAVNEKPETPKQTIKRLTAELADSVAKNEADAKASNERRDSVAKIHQDQVKYYEARLNDTRTEAEKQATRARTAEVKLADANRTISAMKSTIGSLGTAVQYAASIAQVS